MFLRKALLSLSFPCMLSMFPKRATAVSPKENLHQQLPPRRLNVLQSSTLLVPDFFGLQPVLSSQFCVMLLVVI